ncbi:type IV pilus secretin PilQ family protein [Bermanella marisrubri]|uniref:Type 4 fimbrial biogenesis protein PilQ n=1 Tax=Bermanella marisrubri TaxID=207949 RepID=Q1N2I4_9GAMM|nr:type IV pilus secretin PilQ family protein [Bermanella marisrubri]EAT12423.1 type 4 fimbrial biogenesis protein PilQ [Oceanobacter sp. RED65] [Bermanella marisrubri]QIZ85504.1 type IV pilus secretin PilQ family protein [Bermanella marisrubri]
MNRKTIITSLLGILALFSTSTSATILQDISFASLPGDKTEIKLSFDGVPPNVSGYTIEQPARIALDLAETESQLKSKYHEIGMGNARTAVVVGSKSRTRVILNLAELTGYTTRTDGNNLYIMVGNTDQVVKQSENILTDSIASYADTKRQQARKQSRVVDVDFRRGDLGEGQVKITLTDPNTPVDISQESGRIRVELAGVSMSDEFRRRLDVRDFATPVRFIDATIEEQSPVFFIEPSEELYDYLAYQTDNILTVSVKPLTKDEEERIKEERFPYTGEKLSLNFQDIEVRTVLQIIADFTGFNLVASDTVQGNITLRLKNVPWDQALEIVLKSQGLAKQQMGNVLMVGPADQIANRQKIEMEANKQVEEYAPLRTEFIQVRYAKATDILALVSAEGSLLGERGTASVDSRTNTIIIQDTAMSIEGVRRAINILDVPVKQVLIEARIVVASTNVGENLGIRWGGGYGVLDGSDNLTLGGGLDTVSRFNDGITAGSPVRDISETDSVINFPIAAANASTFAFGLSTDEYVLDLELSALESDGKAEIISQPRVITADGQTARIQAGTEIPYEQASASGATSIVFKEAVLKLEATPQITPDDRILMDLIINKDAVGEIFNSIPSIDTNELETQVLVNNGETIVLGGIFQSEDITQVDKTPFFGDLPVIGQLFRRTTRTEDKSELLIFITPRLVKDVISNR